MSSGNVCWVVISIIVVVIIVVDILIYHDISILTIMVTQIAYHSKKFGNFCESLAEVLWCMDKENWYMILQCRKMALDLLWRSSNKNEHAKKK